MSTRLLDALGKAERAAHRARTITSRLSADLKEAQAELSEQLAQLRQTVNKSGPHQLRLVRTALGMTRAELARLAGVAAHTIARFELGYHRPKQKTVERLVAVLKHRAGLRRLNAELLAELDALLETNAPELDAAIDQRFPPTNSTKKN